jgi:hypothetical protein
MNTSNTSIQQPLEFNPYSSLEFNNDHDLTLIQVFDDHIQSTDSLLDLLHFFHGSEEDFDDEFDEEVDENGGVRIDVTESTNMISLFSYCMLKLIKEKRSVTIGSMSTNISNTKYVVDLLLGRL